MYGKGKSRQREQPSSSRQDPEGREHGYNAMNEEMHYEEDRHRDSEIIPRSKNYGARHSRFTHTALRSIRNGKSTKRRSSSVERDDDDDYGCDSFIRAAWISISPRVSGLLSPNTEDHRDGQPEQYTELPTPRNDAPQKRSLHQSLIEEIESLERDNDNLKVDVQGLSSECGRLKNRVETLQSARDVQESRLGRQEQDESITQQFNNVFQPIRNWSGKFCTDASHPVDVSHISSALTPLIQRVIPGMRSLDDLPDFLPVGDTDRRRAFIRGWIAFNLSARILPDSNQVDFESDLWLPHKEREAIETLESTFSPSPHEITKASYHEWRALTFALLDKSFPLPRTGLDEDPFETLKDAIQKTLEVIRPLAFQTPDVADLERTLYENVFVPAVELSRVLRRQRAYWYVCFPHVEMGSDRQGGESSQAYTFQPDQMIDEDDPEDEDQLEQDYRFKAVAIIILPSLYKCGNNDGEKYEINSLMEKALVSCVQIAYEGEEPLV